jgi:hypothetical protein
MILLLLMHLYSHCCILYRHFKYVGTISNAYKYGTQLGVILKREYPGLVEVKDSNGVITGSRPALDWEDYYLMHDGEGVTSADRVKQEFWVCMNLNSL